MEHTGLNQTDDGETVLLCYPHLQGSCPRLNRLPVVQLTMYFFISTMILMTVCGNLLVIISISHFRQLHGPTNFIILSLALADCCLGCFVMPFTMVKNVEGCWYFGQFFCQFHSSLDMMLCAVSILHLCLISVDRYFAICEPLQYRTKITTFKVIILVVIVWLYSFAFSFGLMFSGANSVGFEEFILLNSCAGSCLLLFNTEWGIIAPLVSFFIPGGVMSCLYIKIFHVARKHAKVMSDRVATVTCSDLKNQASEQRERKAAKTLAVVMGGFLLCWMSFFLILVIDPFINFTTPVEVFDTFFWIGYFNSTCNPIIYAFFYPHFRKAFKIILSKTCGIKMAKNIVLSL
ncbi:trace amine-associated receptor 4-like [Chanos chanos]|uniref:Trace amine-associated receptor 4-like n=1 Tax=Chanos chanos TaxID=29144 RepID=A0A6J2W5W7_CHACN|nr:trace amine-associated receptor 4-like [Chanos chanos]